MDPTLESVNYAVQAILAARPRWIAQLAAREFAHAAASTSPIWRWARVPGPVSTVAVRGTSMGATLSGAAGLGLTLGVPLVVAAGVWVMLGSGYYAAKQMVKQRGLMTGFSHGFVMGVLKWDWSHVVSRFAKRFVVRQNVWDPSLDREEAISYNEGLQKGFATGDGVPEAYYPPNGGAPEDKKKAFRIALRRLANVHDSGPWSRNETTAQLQQRDYVISLAGAALRHGLILAV